MTNGQTIILIVLGLIFAISWFYSITFTIKNIEDDTNASLYMLSSIGLGVVCCISILITATSTSELNDIRKKAPKPKYEEVTFTVYKKI